MATTTASNNNSILAIIVIALLTTLTARLTVMRTIYEIDLIRSDPGRTDTYQG